MRGNFDDALRLVRELGTLEGIETQLINPYRIEGQKTASFEIIEELEDAPDLHILPWATPATLPPTGRAIVNFSS